MTGPLNTWMASDWWIGYLADVGPYLGPYPIAPPIPANLPGSAEEIDYMVTEPGVDFSQATAIGLTDNTYKIVWRKWDDPTHTSSSTGSSGPQPDPAGHLYVVWYPPNYDYPGPLPDVEPLSLVPPSYAEGGTGELGVADWQLSPSNSIYVADCGPYLGDWPPMAPFPQQLPPDSAEIDWLITTSSLADILDGTFGFNNSDNYYRVYVSYDGNSERWNRGADSGYYGNIQGPNGGSVFGAGAQPPPPGTHVYLVWYAPNFNTPGSPPVYPALSLIPASYAEGGTATLPVFDTIKPLHQLGPPSEGVVLSRNSWQVRYEPDHQWVDMTEGAFGQPAIGILPDGSYAVAAPWFYGNPDGGRETDNNIKVKVWHLAKDLTVLGTLVLDGKNYDYPYPNLDVWGGYAGCTMAVNRNNEPGLVMVVVYNRMTDPTPTPYTRAGSHCWVIDCTSDVPVLATWGGGTPRYRNERCWISDAAHPWIGGGAASDSRNVQALGFPQLDLGFEALIISNAQQGYANSRAQLFSWGEATARSTGNFSQAFAIPNTRDVVAVHADPANPSSGFALLSSNGDINYFTDTVDGDGHHFALGQSHSSDYTYIVVGGANPFEQNAVYLDHMADDYNSNAWFVELQSETADSRPVFLATGPVLSQNITEQGYSGSMTCGTARVGPRRLAVADQLYSYQEPGRPDGAFKRVYLLDHSGEFAMDSLDLSYPAPIHPDSVSALLAGSDNLDANADTIAVVSLILDNYNINWAGFSGNYPTLVVWTVPVHGGEEMAATAHFYRVIQDGAGNIIIGAQVSFLEPGTGTTIPDQLYADEALETKLDNPFVSLNGIIDVYLERPRTVAVQTLYGNQTQTADYQDVLSNAENILAAMEPVTIDNASFDGGVLRVVGQGSAEWVPMETLSGGVAQILPGTNVTVDDTDPTRPIVNASAGSNVLTGGQANPSNTSITSTGAGAGNSFAGGVHSVAIGNNAHANLQDSVAIGTDATGVNIFDVAIGSGAVAGNLITSGGNCIAIGQGSAAQSIDSIAIGFGANTEDVSASHDSIAIGTGASTTGIEANAYGRNTMAAGNSSTAIGGSARAYSPQSTAIGAVALAGELDNTANHPTLAVGIGTVATKSGAVALGTDSAGFGASSTTADDFVLGTANHKVKVAGRLTVAQRTPTGSADAQGAVGDITSDGSYVYVKTVAGWKRAPLSLLEAPAVTALPKTAAFSSSGPVAVKVGGGRYYIEEAVSIVKVRSSVGTAPTGTTLLVDVNKNGSTIFTTQANRPAIAIGANTATGTPQVTALAVGDYLTVDVDQVGSTLAGADLTVQIELS
jgi:hypothetical protein